MSEEKKIPTYNKEDLEDKQERCLICALDSYEDLIVCVCVEERVKDYLRSIYE